MPNPALVSKVSQWGFYNYNIERLMDHAALTSAHPDNTLVFAGPPRWSDPDNPENSIIDELLPLGMLQQVGFNQAIGIVPGMAIGSARKFWLDGPSNNTVTLARLICNGRNLLRALMTNAIRMGIDPQKLDAKAANEQNSVFYINLDSELFKIPLGLGFVMKDKLHDWIGAVYLENGRIQTHGFGWASAQPMILENANLIFDNVEPIGDVIGSATPYEENLSTLADAAGPGLDGNSGVPTDGTLTDS